MLQFLTGYDSLDIVFLISAAIGAFLFFAQMLLTILGHHAGDVSQMEIGGGDIATTDAMLAHDVGADGGQSSFRLLSVRGTVAFFLIFGLTGLAMHRGGDFGAAISVLGAFVAGFAIMAAMAKLMQAMMSLQSSGNISMDGAVGSHGTVYLHIPDGGGSGQVQVTITNRNVIMDATSDDKRGISTGDRVEVVNIIGGNLLVVKKV